MLCRSVCYSGDVFVFRCTEKIEKILLCAGLLLVNLKALDSTVCFVSAIALTLLWATVSHGACVNGWARPCGQTTCEALCSWNCCKNFYNSTTRKFYRTWWELTEVPRDIPADALEVHLDVNFITAVPDGVFAHLSQCTKLVLSTNQISCVEKKAFRGLVSLQYLTLRRNLIPTIHKEVFAALGLIQGLDLGTNRISFLDKDTFKGLTMIKYLDFYGDSISSIEPGTFQSLSNCTLLKLNHNRISTLARNTFKGMVSLETLHIAGNGMSLEDGAFDHLHSIRFHCGTTDSQL